MSAYSLPNEKALPDDEPSFGASAVDGLLSTHVYVGMSVLKGLRVLTWFRSCIAKSKACWCTESKSTSFFLLLYNRALLRIKTSKYAHYLPLLLPWLP
mgnify:CR=1 FL=1